MVCLYFRLKGSVECADQGRNVMDWSYGEPTLADAILDRLVHQSHRIELKIPGESMRKPEKQVTA